MGFDADTLGNHNFDAGLVQLQSLISLPMTLEHQNRGIESLSKGKTEPRSSARLILPAFSA
jgi:hypothetical protein